MNTDERQAYWRAICAEYRESGLTQKAFSRNRGVALSTLQYWLRRTRSQQDTQASARQLVPVGYAGQAPAQRTVRICTGTKVTLEVDLPVDREELEEILKAAAVL